ncbi:MAG: dihydrodipicolinate synthase family protein, partial [Armatimonadota bacterium]
MKINLNGLVAAPHTPFHADGSLHLGIIEKQVDTLRTNGVTAAFICGTTGEGMSMTLPERRQVAERWVEASRGTGLKVIVNASHLCLGDIQELGAHADSIGADAFAIMAPSFFRPARLEELVAFCAESAKAAPGLPFYYYHMPGMTGVTFPMANFLPQAAEHIPNFGGIKFTSEDLMDYGRTLTAAGDSFEVLFGRDEILLSALALGAKGAIGSTYNFCAPLYHKVIAAYEAGDLPAAQLGQAKVMEMVAVLNRYGGLAAGKAMMALIGVDCGP